VTCQKEKAKQESSNWWNQRFGCAPAHPDGWIICCAQTCSGPFAVYRFSFTLCVFFAVMALVTVGRSKVGATAHRGFWLVKATLLVGLLVSTLFIENETFVGYRNAARILSGGFLLMQILLLIDFGYTWNESWLAYDEASDNDEGICGWRLAVVFSALGMYALSLTGWVLLFVYFGHDGCPAQQTLVSVTLLLCLALTAASCSKIAPHGTLLTSAVVTLYCTYLCYSALASHPDKDCNPFSETDMCSTWEMVFGLVVFAVSMASTAVSATGGKEAIVGRSESAAGDLEKPLDEAPNSTDDEEDEIQPESHWYYHVMMAMCALYMAMLLTSWGSSPADFPGIPYEGYQDDSAKGDVSDFSFWVKIISQWVCFLVYAWTLLAPYLLRNHRDFGIDFSDFD